MKVQNYCKVYTSQWSLAELDIYLNAKETQLFLKWYLLLFHKNNSASDNENAKYRYLPCIQRQNQTAVTYGLRAATRNVRQPLFLKSQSSKIVPILRKNVLNQYRLLKARVGKIKSGTFMFLSTFILS